MELVRLRVPVPLPASLRALPAVSAVSGSHSDASSSIFCADPRCFGVCMDVSPGLVAGKKGDVVERVWLRVLVPLRLASGWLTSVDDCSMADGDAIAEQRKLQEGCMEWRAHHVKWPIPSDSSNELMPP